MRPLAHAFALLLAVAGTARAQSGTPTAYELSDPSQLAWGCMGPCACPVFFTGSMKGGFTLVPTTVDPLFAHYELRDIAWSYDVPGTKRVVHITGTGTYQVGGEFALMQRMQLDVTSDGALVQHYDSGMVPAHTPFPRIDVEVHVDAGSCLDSVLHVVAAPATSSAGTRPPLLRLAASPNPTTAGVEITFAMPETRRARVEVLDVRGRSLATIADGILPQGETHLAWDGRTRSGSDAGVGVFWVVARAGPDTVVSRIVRFR